MKAKQILQNVETMYYNAVPFNEYLIAKHKMIPPSDLGVWILKY